MHTDLQKGAFAVTRWVGSVSSIIVHTLFFAASFGASWLGFIEFYTMLLGLTTVVSLEAIYLAIFIQMTVNAQGKSIREVERDIDEIQEDIDEMQEDVEEIQEDVDELQEDVEDIEEFDEADKQRKADQKRVLQTIQADLQKLIADIEVLRAQIPAAQPAASDTQKKKPAKSPNGTRTSKTRRIAAVIKSASSRLRKK